MPVVLNTYKSFSSHIQSSTYVEPVRLRTECAGRYLGLKERWIHFYSQNVRIIMRLRQIHQCNCRGTAGDWRTLYQHKLNFAVTFGTTYTVLMVHITYQYMSQSNTKTNLLRSNNIAVTHTKTQTGTKPTQNDAHISRGASWFAVPANWMITSRRMRRAGHEACMWEKSSAYGKHLEDIRVCNRIILQSKLNKWEGKDWINLLAPEFYI